MLVKNPLNKENKTAEELFAARNEQLHQEAKEWLMRIDYYSKSAI